MQLRVQAKNNPSWSFPENQRWLEAGGPLDQCRLAVISVSTIYSLVPAHAFGPNPSSKCSGVRLLSWPACDFFVPSLELFTNVGCPFWGSFLLDDWLRNGGGERGTLIRSMLAQVWPVLRLFQTVHVFFRYTIKCCHPSQSPLPVAHPDMSPKRTSRHCANPAGFARLANATRPNPPLIRPGLWLRKQLSPTAIIPPNYGVAGCLERGRRQKRRHPPPGEGCPCPPACRSQDIFYGPAG